MNTIDSKDTNHVAVIGAGYWGRNLVRNFHQIGALKAICDGSPSIRDQMGAAYPDTTLTGDYNSVLDDPDINAVVIAAPAALSWSGKIRQVHKCGNCSIRTHRRNAHEQKTQT